MKAVTLVLTILEHGPTGVVMASQATIRNIYTNSEGATLETLDEPIREEVADMADVLLHKFIELA